MTEQKIEKEGPAEGGPWTRHGHAVPGVTVIGEKRPPVARCGGPALCQKCAVDAERIRASRPVAKAGEA